MAHRQQVNSPASDKDPFSEPWIALSSFARPAGARGRKPEFLRDARAARDTALSIRRKNFREDQRLVALRRRSARTFVNSVPGCSQGPSGAKQDFSRTSTLDGLRQYVERRRRPYRCRC